MAKDRKERYAVWMQANAEAAKATGKTLEKPVPDCPGLYLITQKTGSQAWWYRFKNPTKRDAKGHAILDKLRLGPAVTSDEQATGVWLLGEPLTGEAAEHLAKTVAYLKDQKIDPKPFLEKQARDTKGDLASVNLSGYTVREVFTAFMEDYPLHGGAEVRDSTKLTNSTILGLRRDPKTGKYVPTGNGILGAFKPGKVFAALDKTPVITFDEADKIVRDKANKPIMANAYARLLKQVGGWAKPRYWTENVFADLKKKHPSKSKNRTLVNADEPEDEEDTADIEWHSDELRALWHVIEEANDELQYPYGRMLQFILATGQRPGTGKKEGGGEVRGARWDQFHPKLRDYLKNPKTDWSTVPKPVRLWSIPAAKMKRHRGDDEPQVHKVPLSAIALRILATLPDRGEWLFSHDGKQPVPNNDKAWNRIRERVEQKLGHPVPRWTPHDLRRSVETGMGALGIDPYLAQTITDHKLKGQAATYNRYGYLAPKREALEKWGTKLAELVSSSTT